MAIDETNFVGKNEPILHRKEVFWQMKLIKKIGIFN